MSPRLTLPRGVARAQHAMSDRHVATVRHAALASAASSETARTALHRLERARARTLPRIPAMAQPVTSLAEARHTWPQLSLLRVAPFRPRDRERQGRRLLNIAVAAAALVLAFPFLLVIAALIKLTSRGPVLFAQTRVGLDRRSLSNAGGNTRRHTDQGGKPFTMYKFRTMRPARPDDAQTWALPDDARVTPIGRVLRKFRLDELPQLFNVLRGDMNIVGPRPEQPTIFVYLREQIEGYQRRQRVRPGITGWAQVNQGYDTSVDDVRRKVNYDLEYIRRQSAFEDLKIMLRTVPVMVLRRGGW
jgi:lipopolysaccharide/colanic/teichoic acid biosynthesis glycosyltransferase